MEKNEFVEYVKSLAMKYEVTGENLCHLYLKLEDEEQQKMKELFCKEAKRQGENEVEAGKEWDLLCNLRK